MHHRRRPGGAGAAVAALAAGGARRIAFVGDSLGIPAMAERLSGYRDALQAGGLGEDPALVHDGAHSAEQAERIVGDLLTSALVPPDAVFAANNRSSLGALHAFRAAGPGCRSSVSTTSRPRPCSTRRSRSSARTSARWAPRP